jgi:L-aspartate oxidase
VARRLARHLLADLPPRRQPLLPGPAGGLVHPQGRASLGGRTARDAGVLRSPAALDRLLEHLADTSPAGAGAAGRRRAADRPPAPGRQAWEATNLHTVTAATVAAALRRRESRGCHRRSDAGGEDAAWQGHRVTATLRDGRLRQDVRP